MLGWDLVLVIFGIECHCLITPPYCLLRFAIFPKSLAESEICLAIVGMLLDNFSVASDGCGAISQVEGGFGKATEGLVLSSWLAIASASLRRPARK